MLGHLALFAGHQASGRGAVQVIPTAAAAAAGPTVQCSDRLLAALPSAPAAGEAYQCAVGHSSQAVFQAVERHCKTRPRKQGMRRGSCRNSRSSTGTAQAPQEALATSALTCRARQVGAGTQCVHQGDLYKKERGRFKGCSVAGGACRAAKQGWKLSGGRPCLHVRSPRAAPNKPRPSHLEAFQPGVMGRRRCVGGLLGEGEVVR